MNKKVDTFSFNGLEIPYYHLQYDGEFYQYLRLKNRYLADGTRINSYFANETIKQIKSLEPFDKAFMTIIHYFPDNRSRDLDNNYYKPIIDSIRKARIIEDDSWQNVSLLTLGDLADKEKIEVYVTPHEYAIEFLFTLVPEKFNVALKDMVKIIKK
ncbi:RusA family crossover junction endodeoxyribonuclease [Ornithinibacillus contaminans]|uniref:hypothetical protein n=1 Tax=Ornithinibacillus contaminans TaxID=694055 RepID=UPI0012ED4A3C|nr:hypothetical protein [Ornithinibacillus contaminans]